MSYCGRGAAYAQMSQHELAVRDYDKAIALSPDFSWTYMNRAKTWFVLRQYEKAWADVQAYRKLGGTPEPAFIKELTAASGRSE